MNRYIYYLFLIPFIVNMVGPVPKILFETKDTGTIISMLSAIVIGILFLYFILIFFNRFPGVGFPELLKKHMPKWIFVFLVFCFGLLWFAIGLYTLITITYLMQRFLTPDISTFWITVLFLVFITYGVLLSSKSILYTVEIILWLSLPFLFLVILALYFNQNINWDFIGKAWMHINHQPDYSSFSAAFLPFLGLISLSIFNREFKGEQKQTPLQFLLILILGIGFLFTTYFIPIGYNGFDNIKHITYPFVLSTDSIRINLAFLERVMYVFLILYLSIAFLFLIITWHVGVEFLKSLSSSRSRKQGSRDRTPYFLLSFFWIISLWITVYITQFQIILYANYLFKAIPPFCLIFVLACSYIYRRVKI